MTRTTTTTTTRVHVPYSLIGCILISLWLVVTHDKRLPSTDTMVSRETLVVDERPNPSPKVLMANFIFGDLILSRRFRMFVESAKTSGVDYILVGDTAPRFELPDNFKFLHITWHGLLDRVINITAPNMSQQKVRRLKKARMYKVCDYKPLFAALFPEAVEGYGWWGHCDNDMLMGNVRKFLVKANFSNYDTISGPNDQTTWGPFMLYKNKKVVNELFKLLESPMEDFFSKPGYLSFDEWGKLSHGRSDSMSGIIEKHAERLGLKTTGGFDMVWDIGACTLEYGEKLPPHCAECVHHQDGRLTAYHNTNSEVMLCHYQGSKIYQEQSLANATKFNELLELDAFRASWKEGFDYVA